MYPESIKNRSSRSSWAKRAPGRYHHQPTWLQEPIWIDFPSMFHWFGGGLFRLLQPNCASRIGGTSRKASTISSFRMNHHKLGVTVSSRAMVTNFNAYGFFTLLSFIVRPVKPVPTLYTLSWLFQDMQINLPNFFESDLMIQFYTRTPLLDFEYVRFEPSLAFWKH